MILCAIFRLIIFLLISHLNIKENELNKNEFLGVNRGYYVLSILLKTKKIKIKFVVCGDEIINFHDREQTIIQFFKINRGS